MEEATSKTEIKKALCVFCAKKISKSNIKRHEDSCTMDAQTADNLKKITHFQEPVQNYKSDYSIKLSNRSGSIKALSRESLSFQENAKKLKCNNFNQSYSRSDNLKVHLKNSLSQEHAPKKSVFLCEYSGCSYECSHLKSLIDHLQGIHNAPMIRSQTLNFVNENDFIDWKEEEQARTFSYFSKRNGDRNSFVGVTKYFYCQQHGYDKAAEFRKTKRRVARGCAKTGKVCISSMKATYSKFDGSVTVIYQPTHSHPLHPSSIRSHPLSKETYKFIDEQIAAGTSPLIIQREVKNRAKEKASSFNLENTDNYRDCFVSLKLIKLRARKRRNLMSDASSPKSTTLPVPPSDEDDNVNRQRYRDIWKNRLKENLNKILSLVENDNVPDHILSKMDVEVDFTVKNFDTLLEDVKDVPMMTESVSYSSNEKLKTQMSQGPPLKNTKKRRKPFNAGSAAKKRTVPMVILTYGNGDDKFNTISDPTQPCVLIDQSQCAYELVYCESPTSTNKSPQQEVLTYENVADEDVLFYTECDFDCNSGSTVEGL